MWTIRIRNCVLFCILSTYLQCLTHSKITMSCRAWLCYGPMMRGGCEERNRRQTSRKTLWEKKEKEADGRYPRVPVMGSRLDQVLETGGIKEFLRGKAIIFLMARFPTPRWIKAISLLPKASIPANYPKSPGCTFVRFNYLCQLLLEELSDWPFHLHCHLLNVGNHLFIYHTYRLIGLSSISILSNKEILEQSSSKIL